MTAAHWAALSGDARFEGLAAAEREAVFTEYAAAERRRARHAARDAYTRRS